MPIDPIVAEAPPLEQQRLASVERFGRYLINRGNSTTDEAQLEQWLDGASERLNAKRQFYPSGPSTRTVVVDGTFAVLPDLRLSEACTVVADGQELEAIDLRFLFKQSPVVQPAHAVVLYRYVGTLEITGHWGFAEVPPGIAESCMAWAARAFFRRQARQADVAVDVETGATQSYFARTPSEVVASLQPYTVLGL